VRLVVAASFSAALGLVRAEGPIRQPPPVQIPAAYKTDSLARTPATGTPTLGRADWWTLFGDPTLDDLETRAVRANQNVLQAVAHIEEERLRARISGADFLPRVESDLTASRERTSNNLPFQRGQLLGAVPSFGATGTGTGGGANAPAITTLDIQPRTETVNDFRAPISASYELDVFGRIRHAYNGALASAQAAEADARGVLLSLAADVATDYFQLRSLDAQADILRRTLGFRREQVRITQERLEVGTSDPLDLERARTEQANAEANLADTLRQRAGLENTLAVLCGEAASTFRLPSEALGEHAPPAVPIGVPADLLAHRPDVAQAERQVAAASEAIGVARAQGLPTFTIQGSVGLESSDYHHLFDADSRDLRVMPTINIPIFEGGRNEANLRAARAVYRQAAASYRDVVLGAYRDAESALNDLRGRAVQAEAQGRAATSAQHVLDLTQDRYRKGAVNYFDVVDAERELLSIQLGSAQTLDSRYTATVALVRALGGGWQPGALDAAAKPPAGRKPAK
jgi:multidrug efflux system outer membrane protein